MNTSNGKPPPRVATSHYGIRTAEQQRPPVRVVCPVPGCGRNVTLTQSGYLEWHANGFGFCCDGTNLSPARAANLQIDDEGRLVGVDEMEVLPGQ